MKLSVSKTTRIGLMAVGAGAAALSWAGPGSKGLDQIAAMKAGGFLENKGQWDSRALFYMGTPGKDVWISRDGITLDLFKNDSVIPGQFNEGTRTGHVVKLEFAGASSMSGPVGSHQRPVRVDFMKGRGASEFVTARQFGEAYVSDLYRGVHLRNYQDKGDFRYDLVVMPGADASQVRFNVKGANSVQADPETGGLIIRTSMGPIKQSAPFVYQQVGAVRAAVPASFKVEGSAVSFVLGKFNKNLPLVIDPLVYGSYMGADRGPGPGMSGTETVTGGSADSRGNLYLTGDTQTTNFPILQGPYDVSLRGGQDAYMARMAGDAYALDYCAFIGGTGFDIGDGVKVAESAGIVWLGGRTTSTDFPGTGAFPGGPSVYPAGAPLAWWFMRWSLASDGTLAPEWSFYEGRGGIATGTAQRSDMAVNKAGELYAGGTSTTVSGDAAFTPYIPGSTQGGQDAFIIKYSTFGQTLSMVRIGGPGNETLGRFETLPLGGGLAITGTVQVNGNQDTSGVPVANAQFATTSNVNWTSARLKRGHDAYVVTFGSNMSVWYSGLIGGSSNETGIAVAADPSNNVYVLGQTGSFDFHRTRGAFDENFGSEAFVTKISSGRTISYSTGLRHSETVFPAVIRADGRGVAVIAGTVGFRYPQGATPPANTIPGVIATTPDAIDSTYTGGAESVNPPNNYTGTPPAATAVISSTEGFVQFLNSTGTNLLYGSYIGENSDDFVTDLHVDTVGSTWVLGTTIVSPQFGGAPKAPTGLGAHITGNAFKVGAGGQDGFAIKLRVGLPVMQNLSLSSTAIAGGLGAFTNATVSLRNPAPSGGVVINCSLSDPTITSFSATGGQATRSVVIPAGATSATFPVYSSPVTVASPSDIRVTLDNDFLMARVTINPWLDDFTVTPSTMIGGNQLSVIVRLFQNATQDTRIQLASADTAFVTLPANNEIIVPAGTNTATAVLETSGVDASTLVTIDGLLLGVTRSASSVLERASLTAASFSPGRVLSGEDSALTVLFNGKVGAARTVTLTNTSGIPGLRVQVTAGGPYLTLPQNVQVPAQSSQVVVPAIAPAVASPSSTTVTATEGAQSASGTLFIDDINIASLEILPGVDVLGGTVLTGRITLTRPAGQVPLVFNVSSNNATAGSLATGSDTITVPVGAQVSNTFTFNTNIVSSVQNVAISVSRANFTTATANVIVRPIVLTLDVDPNSVLGGNGATATVSISTPAPAGGLTVDLSTSDGTVATITPAQVTIPAGSTTPAVGTNIVITTVAVPTDVPVTVTGQLGIFSTATDNLLVRAPAVTGLVVTPADIAGGTTATGTVTIEAPAPDGFVLNVSSSDTRATVPATVTIDPGATSATFSVATVVVQTDVDATITVSGSSSSASADIRIVAASVASVTFSPNIVSGGANSTCTIRLTRPAPAGGTTVNIASDSPSMAWSTVASAVVPAGSTSVTVPIRTNRVTRRATVGFTVTVVATGRTARGFLGLRP